MSENGWIIIMIQENITVGGHIKHYNMVIVIAEAESESE